MGRVDGTRGGEPLISFSKTIKTWENISHFTKHNNNVWPNKTNGTEIPCSSGFPRGTVLLLMPGGGLSTWNIRICNVYTFYSVFCHWRVLSTPDLYSRCFIHFIVNNRRQLFFRFVKFYNGGLINLGRMFLLRLIYIYCGCRF